MKHNDLSHPPDLNRAWKRTFWNVYDNLGILFAINMIWLLGAVTIILIPPLTAAVFKTARTISEETADASIRLFFGSMREYFFKSLSVSAAILLILSIMFFNMRFYSSNLGLAGIALAGIFFWIIVFLIITSMYVFPFLVQNTGWMDIFKKSFLFAAGNLKTSLLIFISCVFLAMLTALFPIIGISLGAVFLQNAFLEITAAYNPDIKIIIPARNLKDLWKLP